MRIEEVNQQATVVVYGVPFRGIEEIKKYANSGEPKNNVYVGEDWQCYPCFDSDDYASEHRSYSNFVFAKSKTQLAVKLAAMKRTNWSCNYRKLHADTSVELLPMIYFEGDIIHPLEISVCDEVAFGPASER